MAEQFAMNDRSEVSHIAHSAYGCYFLTAIQTARTRQAKASPGSQDALTETRYHMVSDKCPNISSFAAPDSTI